MADAYGPVIARRLLAIKIYGGCLATSPFLMILFSSFAILCVLYLLAVTGFVVLLATHYIFDHRTKVRTTYDYRP